MSYIHLTITERASIEILRKENYSLRAIAKRLNRSVSTISREIKRNKSNHNYVAETAQTNYETRKKNCGRPSKLTNELINTIIHHLKLRWSPEQIVGRLLQNNICFKTIYRWINANSFTLDLFPYLRHKGKRQQPKETRGRFNVGKPISQRPKSIKKRNSFGHWEADTVVSSRGKSKGCLATFAERKSRYYICFLMPDRSSKSMEVAIKQLISSLPNDAVKTITVDRGKEFSCYKNIESQFDVDIYFAEPYSAWQRGTNENSNGLLREFFPKKTDLAKVTQEELDYALNSINHRPRKCLNWKTSYEILISELLHLN
ncbi:IS30 family transposase [Staphylococcus chromogenes]|uniref:IS30 family transposase n=3 Tax=Staphylococcus chromogenes TaxID=46126 RepID=UPI000D1A16F0|nr:IS30 family transposase [Staphylococcus chromogenes]MCE4967182.1 IS30 family transposase [Staphylococcus chromogenes]PTF74107.1 IS30 family transposase [Staphylococcus chromogenes]PTG49994.1 IS30 family transposase [Staphylococcus chromogenes]RIM06349.1 IS30 family transposase [Staphylococcus chromogenes]